MDSGRSSLTRRHVVALFGVAAAGIVASESVRTRGRFTFNTAADFLYGAFGPRVPVQVAATHPMQYLLSPPRHRRSARDRIVQPRALVIGIDGSDHDFRGYHAAFVRARRDLPFALVTPFVVSNGGRRHPSDYPYSEQALATAAKDPLGFDVEGVSAIIDDVRARFGATLPVYVTGFSAGGHLAWLLLFNYSNWLAGAAFASANFAARGINSESDRASTTPVPVRAFAGEVDPLSEVLRAQWETARTLAAQRGFRDLTRVVVPGAGHSPFARQVLEYFAALANGR